MTNTIELASLILTILAHDDAQTAAELADVIGVTTTELRPALCALIAAGDVVTSGRTRGTRYLLVVEEQAAPATRIRRPRTAKPAIEVVDLSAQLAATLALATPAASLSSVRTEPAPLAQLLTTHDALVAAILEHDPFQSLLPGRTWQEEVLARAAEWQAETAAILGGAS